MVEQGLGIQRGKPSSFSRAGSMDFVWLTVGRANFHDVASGSGIVQFIVLRRGLKGTCSCGSEGYEAKILFGKLS